MRNNYNIEEVTLMSYFLSKIEDLLAARNLSSSVFREKFNELEKSDKNFGEVFDCPICSTSIYWQRFDTYASGSPRLVEDVGNSFEDDPDHECLEKVGYIDN